MTRAAGSSSCSNSSRFGAISRLVWVTPVTLPPGRFRLATRPSWTGSAAVSNTIGMVVVASFAASAAGVLVAAMTAMLNQVDRQRRQAVILALGPAGFGPHIAAVDIARLSQPFEKSRRERRVTLRRCGIEEADHRHRALLGARRQRPRHGSHRRAAEKRDDLAPSHCRLICPLHARGWLAQNQMFHL